MQKKYSPGVYVVKVAVDPDDVTHQKAKDELAQELGDLVEQGFQINGIREPVYEMDDNGNKIVVAYESLVWLPKPEGGGRRYPPRLRDDDDDDFVLTTNGLELRL